MNTPTTEWIAKAMCYGFLRAMHRRSSGWEDALPIEDRQEEHEFALAAMVHNWRPWLPAAADFMNAAGPPSNSEPQPPE